MTTFSYKVLPFSQRLFLSVILLFVTFVGCFVIFQYNREKSFKSELLNIQLQNYNDRLYDHIITKSEQNIDSLRQYVATHMMPDLRVTLINTQGTVVFDNSKKELSTFENHSSRKEVQDALLYGSGYAISRHSASIEGEEYFYSARYYPSKQVIIRSALPYNLSLMQHLSSDSQ